MRYIRTLVTPAIAGAGLFTLLSGLPTSASAGPIGPTYPAPGGTSFSSTLGALTDPGGKTRIYGGFDTSGSLWSELFWNITDGSIRSGSLSSPAYDLVSFNTKYVADGGTGVSSVSAAGNVVQWNLADTFEFVNTSTGFTVSTGVRLVTTFFKADGTTAISGLDLVSSTSGDGLPQVVLAMTPADLIAWGGGFQVKQEYQTTGGTALGTFFNMNNGGGGNLNTGTNAAFWYDPPAAVPEPASMVLLGSGLLGVARKLRRRKDVR